MKHSFFPKTAALLLLWLFPSLIFAESVTYTVIKDDDLGTVINGFGQKPENSYVYFENEFGDIIGNRYNQITKNKEAILELYGWEGCTINSITFNMCSNMASGGAQVTVSADSVILFKQRAQFNAPEWYGEWVGHQNYIYVDITKTMSQSHVIKENEIISIIIEGTESSVYINSYTIDYDPGSNRTESPLGYVYEKIPKNGTLTEGDNVIIYYAGVAASDLVGGTNPFLSIYKVHSTANVFEPELMYFTAHKKNEHWQFVNQYGDTLSATGEKKMAWDNGVSTWNVTFVFEGAQITNTNANYGTIRYNTSTGDRFTTYTSTSMKLPYLYKRVRQNTPIEVVSLTLPENLSIPINKDTTILRPTILPVTATDQRVTWKSADENIATVRDGIIKPVSLGTTDIIVFSADRSLSDTCRVTVINSENAIEYVKTITGVYTREGKIIVEQTAPTDIAIFNTLGQLFRIKENVQFAEFNVPKGIYIIKIGTTATQVVVK
ncbi:MAG TPA: T9SS type A sorting domain-containing protein [Paludibacteraceae bacterium]|nr:T9SS type A sorting domain-containing protein [Paludibacteraceae bacterium]HOS37303.1 T9SS type A sorting domain-containing protein [Paludibacteraceae bacterium]HPK20085.1 T9SS type A sorting domain-containing protein [Paludibacteraceae bacterium]